MSTLHLRRRFKVLGCQIQRHKPPRGRGTIQRSRLLSRSHEFANSRSTEETHARQPTTHSSGFYSDCRKEVDLTFLPTSIARNALGETSISKLVRKLVRHLGQEDRGTDGAVHWKLMGPNLRHAFQERGGCTFADSQWLGQIWNEA